MRDGEPFLAGKHPTGREWDENSQFPHGARDRTGMTSSLKSAASVKEGHDQEQPNRPATPPGWVKVGAVAAASAVLGGLAAAWFYRRTLSQLREAGDEVQYPESGTIVDAAPEDF